MSLTKLSVDRFGNLNKLTLPCLSPELSVIYGGNGSGKTALVNFLRGILFGYESPSATWDLKGSAVGGTVELTSSTGPCRLSRHRRENGLESVQIQDMVHDQAMDSLQGLLPAWVSEAVYREIFSVGYQEAERFDLLVHLCLHDHGGTDLQQERRRTELAIEQSVREREGFHDEPGLRHRIADATQHLDSLKNQLAELQRTCPSLADRIAESENELGNLVQHIEGLDEKASQLQLEIRQLEQAVQSSVTHRPITLDENAIHARILLLTAERDQWATLRRQIEQRCDPVESSGVRSHLSEFVNSMRAITTRLEDRVGSESAAADRGVVVKQIQQEVYALCGFLANHETNLERHWAQDRHEHAVNAIRELKCIESSLDSRLDSLNADLAYATDVLKGLSVHDSAKCQSQTHAQYQPDSQRLPDTSATSQLQLTQLHKDYAALIAERNQSEERSVVLRTEIARHRNELTIAAELEDIDRIQAGIAGVEDELGLLHARWQVLERTEARLSTVVAELGRQVQPDVLQVASNYLQRLTQGDCFRIEIDESHCLLISTKASESRQRIDVLSRGTRDQVALALRVALIQDRLGNEHRVPLILDDVFITSDDERAIEAAELLKEVANSGQQIIFLTSQKDVCDLLTSRGAEFFTLELSEESPAVDLPAIAPPAVSLSEAGAGDLAEESTDTSLVFKAFSGEAEEFPGEMEERVPGESTITGNWLFYLELDNDIADLAGLTSLEREALESVRVLTVDDLLSRSADELTGQLPAAGYSISNERIAAWRGQAEMACRIPMLRRRDAELLYLSGIRSVEQLSRMRPEVVFDRVNEYRQSLSESRRSYFGPLDRQQTINWTRSSLHSRTMKTARESRGWLASAGGRRARIRGRLDSRASTSTDSRSESGGREENGVQSGSTVVLPRPRIAAGSRGNRMQRNLRRRRREERNSRQPGTSQTESRRLRFYLSRSSAVEDAPSIGPRTAERLAKVNIITVDDLLTADAAEIAEQLDHKRITAEVIEIWQDQARLVCQIPQLRGHDAQILVACGITSPQQLTAQAAASLFEEVGPFCDTTEGERILRGGRKPDLDEVAEWILWAQSSRSLNAAA